MNHSPISHPRNFIILIIYPLLSIGLFAADKESEKNNQVVQIPAESVSNLRLEYSQVESRPVAASTPVTGTIQYDSTKVYDVVPRISGIVAKDHRSLGQ